MHTVKGAHAQTVSALIPHPFEPGSLASIGSEGTVCTWDIGRGRHGGGRCASRFENFLTEGPQSEQVHYDMPVTVLDGVYSPDGSSIAVADFVRACTRRRVFFQV